MVRKNISLAMVVIMIAWILPFSTTLVNAEGRADGTNIAISTSRSTSFAIYHDGSLWGWGWNGSGKIGNGTTKTVYSPVQIMNDVVAVSSGDEYTMAIKSDNSLWGWGTNESGQLGNGKITIYDEDYNVVVDNDYRTPVKIMEDVASVSAGARHTMVIKTDGSLWGFGTGAHRIGNYTSEVHLNPVWIMNDVVAVSAGLHHTMAIKTDGSLWGWGSNNFGQLGDGAGGWFTQSLAPIKIMEDVVAVSSGSVHTMAIKADGTLWGWGDNFYGQVGDGTVATIIDGKYISEDSYHFSPVQVMEDVIAVSAGNGSTMVIKTDGSLWGFGSNGMGSLGDGTSENRYSPIKIIENVVAVSTGNGHTLAIRTDGSLYAWGNNFFACLGDGTWEEQSRPKRVLENVVWLIPVPPVGVLLNGADIEFDVVPIIENGRTLVPLRAIFEALGAEVTWNKEEQAIFAVCGECKEEGITHSITMKIGEPYMYSTKSYSEKTPTQDMVKIELDVPPMIVDGRTLVPVRAIAESFDVKVEWNEKTKTVILAN